MRKQVVLLIGLLGVILVSFASAGLVEFLSNQINSEFEMNGPIFYLSSGNELTINEVPSGSAWNLISSGSYVEREWVISEDNALGGIDFYDPKIELTYHIDINESAEFGNDVRLTFGFYNNKGQRREICTVAVLGVMSDGIYTHSCGDLEYSSYKMDGIEKFYYSFETLSRDQIKIKTRDSYAEFVGVRNE